MHNTLVTTATRARVYFPLQVGTGEDTIFSFTVQIFTTPSLVQALEPEWHHLALGAASLPTPGTLGAGSGSSRSSGVWGGGVVAAVAAVVELTLLSLAPASVQRLI